MAHIYILTVWVGSSYMQHYIQQIHRNDCKHNEHIYGFDSRVGCPNPQDNFVIAGRHGTHIQANIWQQASREGRLTMDGPLQILVVDWLIQSYIGRVISLCLLYPSASHFKFKIYPTFWWNKYLTAAYHWEYSIFSVGATINHNSFKFPELIDTPEYNKAWPRPGDYIWSLCLTSVLSRELHKVQPRGMSMPVLTSNIR